MRSTRGEGAPIGVGIVGLSASGGWAAMAHAPALAALPGYVLVGGAAGSAESSRRTAEHYRLPKQFDRVEDLVEDEDVGLVVVAVKVPDHDSVVRQAVAAGKAVLTEWPLATDLSHARALAGLAKVAGVRTAVGLQARSAPGIRHVRDLVADGFVGEVLSTTVVASGRNWGARFEDRGRYQLNAANGTTLLTVSAGHTLDALRFVLGEINELTSTVATRRPVVRQSDTGAPAPMSAPDQVAVTGTLHSGAVASLHFRGGLSRGENFRWEINGTEGDLVITSDWAHPQFGELTLLGGRGADPAVHPMTVPAAYGRVGSLDAASPAYNVAHAYLQLGEDWNTGSAVVPDFDHAVTHHELLDRITAMASRPSQTVSGRSAVPR